MRKSGHQPVQESRRPLSTGLVNTYLPMMVRMCSPDSPFTTREEARAGWRIALPACVAYVPLGLALGVLVVQSGFQWWWAPILSAFVYAGSMEFLLVGLLTVAAPLTQIAAGTLLVNFRHVFYALSFPLHRVVGRGWKAYATYTLTDEAYALTTNPASARWSHTRIMTIVSCLHACWISSVTAGAGLGLLIPPNIVGLDFAVTALFVVLGMESYRARPSLPIPITALLCALTARVISEQNMLIIAMGFFLTCLVVAFLVRGRGSEEKENDHA